MFINVGRFTFRPMSQEERQQLAVRLEQDIPPIVRASPGFRGVSFLRVGADEMMAVWLWDSAADWDAALARLGPWLQANAFPYLAKPPERVGGDVVLEIKP
jgi:hypothetical protein